MENNNDKKCEEHNLGIIEIDEKASNCSKQTIEKDMKSPINILEEIGIISNVHSGTFYQNQQRPKTIPIDKKKILSSTGDFKNSLQQAMGTNPIKGSLDHFDNKLAAQALAMKARLNYKGN